MHAETPSSLLKPRTSRNLPVSENNNLNKLPSLANGYEHTSARPSKFNLDPPKYLSSRNSGLDSSKQYLDSLGQPMAIRIVAPSRNDFMESQLLKTPVDTQPMRLSSFICLTPSLQQANALETNQNSKASFSVLPKTKKSMARISLKNQVEVERQQSESKIKTLQKHFDENEGLSGHLRNKYVSIVKNLDNIKIKSIEEELVFRKSQPWNLGIESGETNMFESVKVRIRNVQDINRYRKRLLRVYNLVNEEKLWKRT